MEAEWAIAIILCVVAGLVTVGGVAFPLAFRHAPATFYRKVLAGCLIAVFLLLGMAVVIGLVASHQEKIAASAPVTSSAPERHLGGMYIASDAVGTTTENVVVVGATPGIEDHGKGSRHINDVIVGTDRRPLPVTAAPAAPAAPSVPAP